MRLFVEILAVSLLIAFLTSGLDINGKHYGPVAPRGSCGGAPLRIEWGTEVRR